MMALLSGLWSRFAGYVVALGALLAILVGAFLKGRSDGKAVMREEQERHRREAITKKRKLDDEIDDLAPADLDQRMGRWVRSEDDR
jgi:hypothetical protein